MFNCSETDSGEGTDSGSGRSLTTFQASLHSGLHIFLPIPNRGPRMKRPRKPFGALTLAGTD